VPFGFVTRFISPIALRTSGMKLTTSSDNVRSNVAVSKRICCASPISKLMSVLPCRARASATYDPAGSMPKMRLDGAVFARAAVNAPVPDPTSSTVSPSCTPANPTKRGARRRLHLPMKRS
jgi:hypothetical protein